MVQDHRGKVIADLVVLAVPTAPKNALRAKPSVDVVDRVDKQCVPYVETVFFGSTLHFSNGDKTRHEYPARHLRDIPQAA